MPDEIRGGPPPGPPQALYIAIEQSNINLTYIGSLSGIAATADLQNRYSALVESLMKMLYEEITPAIEGFDVRTLNEDIEEGAVSFHTLPFPKPSK